MMGAQNLQNIHGQHLLLEPASKADTSPSTPREPIAIIGIACRFPGAKGPEAFWRLLCDGRDAITEVPAERFDIDAVYDPRPGRPGKLYTRWGGFLDQVDQFDPYFFGISPREATAMDPQHRLLLEVAWEALEDAGQVPHRLAGSQVGVFVGMCTNDYGELLKDSADIDIYFSAGNARSILSGRISYGLGLEGPSVVVDTACSTSLVTVHLACQSLWNGESKLALAGGVNLILSPEPSLGFCQARMLARNGRCKAFDARGDGFVRSDGVGIIVLKPLSMALADHDPVYALIRGSAVNNDGRSGGLLMTPSRPGQEAVLREAYRNSGVSPGQVQYVEAHGTGTSVGDPIEALALGTVLAGDRPQDRPCLIGSVKTNIGHAEAAAGIAGLIKVALSLKHRMLPPSLHFQEPNPDIPWQDLPLVVQRDLTPWPANTKPALAGVSSFGISGTNAHIVLEEAPQTAAAAEAAPALTALAHLLPLSAHTPEALEALARAYQERIVGQGEDTPRLQDLCYTASVKRTHHDHRLGLVVCSPEELTEHLTAFLQGDLLPGIVSGRRIPDRQRKLVFVFPGQGSQWIGMARDLLDHEPVFREALERCDRAMRQYVEWSLLEELTADEARSRLDELDVVQPMLFAVYVALATLWRSWGVEPDAVVGHSMGEVAAAHIAGILGLDDAVRIICCRSRVVKQRAAGKGGMAVLELPIPAVQDLLVSFNGSLAVAACNSPTTTVVAGDPAALQALQQTAERQGAFFQMVKVDYASHSPQMEPLREELLAVLDGIRPQHASLPMLSTVTKTFLDGPECDAAYWVQNICEPVLFAQAIEHLVQNSHDLFLEVSPHPVLTAALSQCLRRSDVEGAVLPSLRRGEEARAMLLRSLGALYTLGYPVDWSRLYPAGGRCVRLPAYPWQRERFWLEETGTNGGGAHAGSASRRAGKRRHLLDQHVQSAMHAGTHLWEMDLSTRLFPYLSDHRVQGLIVLPAAAYVEMALSAAVEAFGAGPHALEKLAFHKALFLPEDGAQTMQLVIAPQMVGEASVQFFSLQADAASPQATWTLHATGMLRLAQTPAPLAHDSPEQIRARCPDVMSGADFYHMAQEHGLQYGPSFQGVEQLWGGTGEAVGRLQPADTVQSEAGAYHLHPALLDSCFQVLAAALQRAHAGVGEAGIFLPIGMEKIRLYARPDTALWGHALLRPDARVEADTFTGDVYLLDEAGQVVLEVVGFRAQRLERSTPHAMRQDIHEWLYDIQWQPMARQQPDQGLDALPPEQRGSWLIFADGSGVGQQLREFLEARGETCVTLLPGARYAMADSGRYHLEPASGEDFRQCLSHAQGPEQPPLRGVVHLWSLDTTAPEATTLASLETTRRLGCTSVLHLVQALAEARRTPSPRLWLVTRGTQAVGAQTTPVAVAQAPVWGLGGVIAVEQPELRCTKIDLSLSQSPDEVQSLFQELWSEDREDQVALRGEARYVARLVRRAPQRREETQRVALADESFQLEVPTPGILENFILRATPRQQPASGQVEIQVRAIGLNFRDVLIAMGVIPPAFGNAISFGYECAGTVTALGKGVRGLQVGDDVLAIAPASFAAFTTTPATLVVPKPAPISFEEGATLPITFLTAHYALNYLGRLRKGERVLIHAAAGGVGLAAVQLAQRVGAEIFATAGSPEKRQFLQSLGIQHVMHSRSLAFAEEVMERTNGEGVDVVLNSLAGDFIPKSLATLRSAGRFLEIGRVDILQNSQLGLRHFENNVAFFAIDLSQLILKQPAFCRTLLREVMQYFAEGTVKPLPFQAFPLSESVEAFRYLAQARHIGKVVVSASEQEVLVTSPSEEPMTFLADGTYLITGGLGGLGLTVAQWMVQQGARHLVLMGRSGAASAEAREAVEALQQIGCEVMVARADVSRAEQVDHVLGDIKRFMPPLRGVVHTAAVLDDGILLQLNEERLQTVMAPKAHGAWNLHTLTQDMPLDFFVLFSSAASVLASPGQGTYVAANAFLDALAHHRRALGLPALTVNWGLWGEVGLAARPDITKRLVQQGIVPFTPGQGVLMLERLLQYKATQVMAMAVDWGKLLRLYTPPLLSTLAQEVARHDGPSSSPRQQDGLTRAKLLMAEPGERQPLVEAFVREQVARVLRLSPSKVDMHQPLDKLGIDSLMAVEVKNRLETDLEVAVPVTALLQGPSLAQLTTLLLDQLPAPVSAPSASPLPSEETPKQLLAKVEQLSDEEVESLLRDMVHEERA